MTGLVEVETTDTKISNATPGFSPEQVAIIKSTVARNTSNTELALFLQVAKGFDLNPFKKEIWCYKDSRNNLIMFAGRDGFLSLAQRNSNFAGIRSCEVRAKDDFEIDVANKKIKHTITGWGEDRGKLVGAYAIVFRKNGEPTIEVVEFKRYDKGRNTWKTHPEDMIKKVAETKALKKAMGISGLQTQDDFDIKSGIAIPTQRKINFSDEIELLRDNQDLSNDDFVKKVSMDLIEKVAPQTDGEKKLILEALENGKYDFVTGDRIPGEINAAQKEN